MKTDLIIEQTASWVAKKIRDRERRTMKRDNAPTCVYITDRMDEEHDILVRSLNNPPPGRGYDMLGVYKHPTREMIMEDLEAFYA